jgi:hypothetical protein
MPGERLQVHVQAAVPADCLVKLNGAYYKRVDRPFSYWKLLPSTERKLRMREYMRQYRRRKRAEQTQLHTSEQK